MSKLAGSAAVRKPGKLIAITGSHLDSAVVPPNRKGRLR